MDAIGIVEVLNTKLESMKCKKGIHFILHKEIKYNSFSKAYKEYRWTLWYINNEDKSVVNTLSYTDKATTENEYSKINEYMEKSFLSLIYSLLLDNSNLNLMLNGKYRGNNPD